MGWTIHYDIPTDERREILNILRWPYPAEVLKLRKVGSIWFAAVRFSPKGDTLPENIRGQYTPDHTGSITACIVILTSRKNGEWGYKDMSEDMGPAEPYCRCPNSILKLLSPTSNPYALAFRDRCRRWNNRSRLNIGDRIRIPEPAPGWGTEFIKVKYGRHRNVFQRVVDGALVQLRSRDLTSMEKIA